MAPWRRLIAVGLVACTACTADEPVEDDGVEVAAADPVPSVTIPPARLTPFCQAMIDLTDRLETDPPDDSRALIIETYESVADEVPAAIEVEFAAVLARLRGDEPAVTSTADDVAAVTTIDPSRASGATDEPVAPEGDDFFEEGYSPDEDPALRVNDYVEFACRDSVNNPGPPPTQPLADVVLEGDEPDG